MKNVLRLFAVFIYFSCPDVLASKVTDYTAFHSNDVYHINKNGTEIYSFQTSPALYRFEMLSNNLLLAIFEYERGNAIILLIDNSNSNVTDTLELNHLESLSKAESALVFGGENKSMFLEPGYPFWPQVFSIENNKFVKEEISKFPKYIIQSLKITIEYLDHISCSCENNLENCFYKREYSKAVMQLRKLSGLLIF